MPFHFQPVMVWRWLAALLVCALPALACALEAVRIDARSAAQAIVAKAEVLEDTSGRLDLPGARAAPGWQAAKGNALGFGYTPSSFWVRWRVVNTGAQAQDAVLNLGQPRQDFAHAFVLDARGTTVTEARAGDYLPTPTQPLAARNIAFPFTLAANEQVEVYVRLWTHDGLFEALPITLHTRADFDAVMDVETKLLMTFHGGLLALLLYNLLLFVATRQRDFGLYAHYLVWFLAWNLTHRGFLAQHLWPQSPAFNNDFLTIATAGAFAAVGVFAISYLRLREHMPRWVLWLMGGLIALNVVDAGVALTGHYALGVVLGWATGLPLAVTTVVVAAVLAARGFRPARFYVIAFTVLCLGVAAYIAQIATLAPTNWFTTWGMQIGSVIEVLLLALGLADSLNTLKAEKLAAERREREAQQALATKLELQVKDRTQALERANRRLRDLSITDELTGAFNRRHFNDFCAQLLAHHPRQQPLAFCMFDIDHFKDFNDQHGHRAGDEALHAISGAVQAELRRSGDLLFRLGGEEFGVLFTATSPESATQFVERLRCTIRELQITHPRNPARVVTASFGVAWWGLPPDRELTRDELYARADSLLYEAKAAGRDRLAVQAM